MPAKKPKGDYAISTVINALRLLEEFRETSELGVTELAKRLELHKNNVFRLLATLEQHGYIQQSKANERYRLGSRCLELGEAFSRSHSLLDRARPVLRELVHSVGETAHLGLMSSFEVVHVDAAIPHRTILIASRVGQRLPLHCTALGKVLLGLGTDECRRTFDETLGEGRTLPRRTPDTIVDPLKFFEHLRTVAGQGFALDIGECDDGLTCAGAPVYDRSGLVVAALSISGPSFRLGVDHLRRHVVPDVCEAAAQLSRELGHHPH